MTQHRSVHFLLENFGVLVFGGECEGNSTGASCWVRVFFVESKGNPRGGVFV